MTHPIRFVLLLGAVALLAGCHGTEYLMPTPNLYSYGMKEPFTNVPPELQNNKVEVLYLTDRKEAEHSTEQNRMYGFGRSRSLAFGVATMEIGENVSWDELVQASKVAKRAKKLPLKVLNTHEIVRFPPTPKALAELPTPTERENLPTTTTGPTPPLLQEIETEKDVARAELTKRLAKCDVKDVYLFVHGYANAFNDAVLTIGQMWHFMGRQGIPVAYTWPAGRGGLLRGYTYDRESSEFTVYHLKETLRAIAKNPDVHRIHIICHSRGTDVAVSALRELHLEFTGGGKKTRDELKLGAFIMAAPDLDMEVVIQRMVTAHLGRVPERFTMYVCQKDNALGISNWLFSGGSRLGKIRGDMFTADELESLRKNTTAQIVDARIKDPGPFGHSYFHANPAVSSDVILTIRYGLLPGAERPLLADPKGFWYLDDWYPREPKAEKGEKSAATEN
jgi:esterase/lipase superfamily enzyme